MKTASGMLVTALGTSLSLYRANLYTFTLKSGTVLRYTDFDGDITVPGSPSRTFTAPGPIIKRGQIRTVIGVEVDTLGIELYATAAHTVDGVAILAALRAGAFDGARILVERLYMETPGDASLGTIIKFSGIMSEIPEIGRHHAQITFSSDLELLNVKLPRNLFQPGCVNTLFDAACGLNKASYGVAGTVSASGSTTTRIACSLSNPLNYFTRGRITFTSGSLNGRSFGIRYYSPGEIHLLLPMPVTPDAGAGLIAYPGCDKQKATCSSKFSNLPRFRGHPYVPAPETIY